MNTHALLAGKIALVTASNGGIGIEIAAQLGEAGAATVFINGRDEERGNRAREQLSARVPACEFLFVRADLRSFPDCQKLFSSIGERFGKLDIFVHCGTSQSKPDIFSRIDPALYDNMIAGHLGSTLHCCHLALPLLKEAGGGAIVTVASDAGKVATPSETIIGALKASVIMFTRTLAMEVSRDNIRANCITPSLVADTAAYDRMMTGGTSQKVFEKAANRAKLGLPTPADIAPLAVFLASPLASKITGQAISVNGGISAA